MSDLVLNDTNSRLDAALAAGLVTTGTRFLYTHNGGGICREGTLSETSPLGHVKLDTTTGEWHWPEDLRVEEILNQPEPVAPAATRASNIPIPPATPPPLPKASSGKGKRNDY